MNNTKEMVDLRRKVVELRKEYNPSLLLEIVESFKEIIDQEEIENRMYMEATQELLEDLENGETTIESIYDDIGITLREHHSLLKEYRNEKLTMERESFLRVHLTLPIDLLLVVYIYKHPEYNSEVDLWDFEKQLEPFTNALEDN